MQSVKSGCHDRRLHFPAGDELMLKVAALRFKPARLSSIAKAIGYCGYKAHKQRVLLVTTVGKGSKSITNLVFQECGDPPTATN